MEKYLSLIDNPRFRLLTDSFIGFDNMFMDMSNILSNATVDVSFPKYDIYQDKIDGEYHTFIKLALAGIPKESLRVEFSNNRLKIYNVETDETSSKSSTRKNIRLGIAQRKFAIEKQISPTLSLVGASYKDGCLTIEFKPSPKDESSFVEIK